MPNTTLDFSQTSLVFCPQRHLSPEELTEQRIPPNSPEYQIRYHLHEDNYYLVDEDGNTLEVRPGSSKNPVQDLTQKIFSLLVKPE